LKKISNPQQVARNLARRAGLRRWFDESYGESFVQGYSPGCIALKTEDSEHLFEPTNVNPTLADAIRVLDEIAVLTMSSNITAGIMELINPFQKSLSTQQAGNRLPILTSLSDVTPDLGHYSKACIIRNEKLILIWSDSSETIMSVGNDIEAELYNFVSVI
jgi:hypothetical protein